MKIAVMGMAQSGKKTLFTLISKKKLSENEIASGAAVEGITEIIDPRFEKLVEMYNPESVARARINVTLLPRIDKGFSSKPEFINELDTYDAYLVVIRAFNNESVYHPTGSVDAERDLEEIEMELTFNDLSFVDKRMQRLSNERGAKTPQTEKEKEVLPKLKAHLEKELPLRTLILLPEELKLISSYPLVTFKELIIAFNISEDDLNNTELIKKCEEKYKGRKINFIAVSAKLEAEVAAIENKEEREEFLKSMGISEPVVDVIRRACLVAMDLISFFGVGSDEVKQWLVKRGSSAPKAAGAIHSDLEKGFIRAEVMKYSELVVAGSEVRLKETGKHYLKGKEYVVEDGDILSILHSS
ncbi:MAG: DUF933 domain-containing protein [Candidatus Firestonebacteria bacterium]|nr:DUF933 domain-containing protein [Candidatus Firestonebacteria bacterium]